MPMAPLTLKDPDTSENWMWTAASVLALRSSPKLAFDPSLPVDFDGDGKDSGLSMLERYVSRLLDDSFADSSLFWHYAMRHVPTPSLACAKDYSSTNYRPSSANLTFANDARLPPPVPDTPKDIPAHGYGAFPLGGARSMCLCGWPRSSDQASCQVPPALCTHLGLAHNCSYDPSTQAGRGLRTSILRLEQADWQGKSWPCPELDLSDAWGIISAKDSEDWIMAGSKPVAQQSTRLSELLRAGRAGLRIGNAGTLASDAREQIVPPAREHPLLPEDDDRSTGAALNRCSDTILKTFDPVSVAREVVDDLFPVAQGIYEAAPMSSCLRYSIEFSRLRMLRALQGLGKNVQEEVALQKSVTDAWRGKCESQLNMLAVCKSNGLFDTIPAKEFPYECPFRITDVYESPEKGGGRYHYYVAPGSCLLYHAGSFYSPCRHASKKCANQNNQATTFTVAEVVADSANTRVRFDVRSTSSSGEVLGSWPTKFYDPDEAKNLVAAQVVERIERWRATSSSSSAAEGANFEAENLPGDATNRGANIPWRLGKQFIEQVVMDAGKAAKGSVGNTQGAWGTSEGLATDGKGAAAEYCDAIADWWPDVGFCLLLLLLLLRNMWNVFFYFLIHHDENDKHFDGCRTGPSRWGTTSRSPAARTRPGTGPSTPPLQSTATTAPSS